nr:zinc finger protein 184-like [Aedes albopictus]
MDFDYNMDFDWGYVFRPIDPVEEIPSAIEAAVLSELKATLPLENLSSEELTSTLKQCEDEPQGFGNFPELWRDSKPHIPTQEHLLPALTDQPMQMWNVENTDLKVGVKFLGYADELNLPSQPVKKPRSSKLKRFTSQWNCEQCGKAFKSKGGLTQHNEKIHSGPTPHRCDICGKRYRDFDSMDQHRQRHLMKDKPCKCSECPKQFIRESDLRRHMGLHHGVSPHRCDICGKAFDRADHLTEHKWSHANGTVKKPKV